MQNDKLVEALDGVCNGLVDEVAGMIGASAEQRLALSYAEAEMRNRLASLDLSATLSRSDDGAGEAEQAECAGMDKAATFCIETLAKALDVDDWQIADGSEEWHGDVAGTIYNVLKAGRVYDDEDGRVARLEATHPPVADAAHPPADALREALAEAKAGFEAVNVLLSAMSNGRPSIMVETFIERIDAALSEAPSAGIKNIRARADAIAHLTVPEDGNYRSNGQYKREWRIARDAARAAFEEIAAHPTPVEPVGLRDRNKIALAICNEQRKAHGLPPFNALEDMKPHHYRDQLRWADAVLSAITRTDEASTDGEGR